MDRILNHDIIMIIVHTQYYFGFMSMGPGNYLTPDGS